MLRVMVRFTGWVLGIIVARERRPALPADNTPRRLAASTPDDERVRVWGGADTVSKVVERDGHWWPR